MNLLSLSILLLFLSSCVSLPLKNSQIPADFVNDGFCTVQLAFKACILKTPNYRVADNTACKGQRDDLLYVVGFEKGMAKVRYNANCTGYISDRYFKTNIFYDNWKGAYFARMHHRESAENTFSAAQK